MDEAHHVLPTERDPNATALPPTVPASIFVTVDPETLARTALEHADDLFVVGTKIAETVQAFCRALAIDAPQLPNEQPEAGEALLWRRERGEPPQIVAIHPTSQKSERHTRKYAEGELGEDKSFYFRGPNEALNLRAQNSQSVHANRRWGRRPDLAPSSAATRLLTLDERGYQR